MAKRVIWKFELNAVGSSDVYMPHGAQTLNVQGQGNVPVLWAICDPDAPKAFRRFRLVMTGQEFDQPTARAALYRGTVQLDNGTFVLHVFEEPLVGTDLLSEASTGDHRGVAPK